MIWQGEKVYNSLIVNPPLITRQKDCQPDIQHRHPTRKEFKLIREVYAGYFTNFF
jgi:hypothetical protein